jgi:hypothetical protein
MIDTLNFTYVRHRKNKGGYLLIQTFKNIVGIIVGLLAAYGLITKTFDELSLLIPAFWGQFSGRRILDFN